MTLAGHYPISVIEFDFECLATSIDVLIVASKHHFGVLIPLTGLPSIMRTNDAGEGHGVLFEEVLDVFPALALDYTEACEENGCVLQIPDHGKLDGAFCGVYLELTGTVPKTMGSIYTKDDLTLFGQYLFVTRDGVDISEFLFESDEEGNKRVLQ
jgi:hypothetical protein